MEGITRPAAHAFHKYVRHRACQTPHVCVPSLHMYSRGSPTAIYIRHMHSLRTRCLLAAWPARCAFWRARGVRAVCLCGRARSLQFTVGTVPSRDAAKRMSLALRAESEHLLSIWGSSWRRGRWRIYVYFNGGL